MCGLSRSIVVGSVGQLRNNFQVRRLEANWTHTHTYRVSQEESARFRESVPYVKVYRYNPKHLCPNLNGYGDNGQRSLKLLTTVTHFLITKYILKPTGICGFCNVNICT